MLYRTCKSLVRMPGHTPLSRRRGRFRFARTVTPFDPPDVWLRAPDIFTTCNFNKSTFNDAQQSRHTQRFLPPESLTRRNSPHSQESACRGAAVTFVAGWLLLSILVVRRDNIGDLVCTTPLIRALRACFPAARIDALVNSYNRSVLANNPDVDNVYAYTRAKHREPHETLAEVHWHRLKLLMALRRQRYHWAILANGGCLSRPLRLARWVAPRAIVGFVPPGSVRTDIGVGVPLDGLPRHEVEDLFRLLQPLGIVGAPPPLRLVNSPEAARAARDRLARERWYDASTPVVAIHISARKVSQRWPAERFVSLMQRLNMTHGVQFILLWSPGEEDNPLHPGDSRKAAAIMAACARLPVLAYPTSRLEELIGALSLCSAMVCSDGGAMHVGAGLGLPIVCFFGDSDATRWRPWGVRHELLQKASQDVSDISVTEACEAFDRLSVGSNALGSQRLRKRVESRIGWI